MTPGSIQFTGNNVRAVQAALGEGLFRQYGLGDDPEVLARVWNRLSSTWIDVRCGDWLSVGSRGECAVSSSCPA